MLSDTAHGFRLAERVRHLGGDTTPYAVFEAAAAHAARGFRVYPFHIGDLNIPTPRNIIEAGYRAMRDGKTSYAPSAGILPLREAVAEEVGRLHGVRYEPRHVAIQSGGCAVIIKFVQTLINPGEEVLYPSPGFPVYDSAIRVFGGVPRAYRVIDTGDGFRIDLDHMAGQITPNTRGLILNNCQNPTAAECDRADNERLADLILAHDLAVLADDAYAEIRYGGETHFLQCLPGLADHIVTLYTFSKKYAMTGWRLGAAIGPPPVIDAFRALSADESGGVTFSQWAGIEALRGDQRGAVELLATLRARRDLILEMLADVPGINVAPPVSSIYIYPEVGEAMQRVGAGTLDAFASAALHETGVSFCTRKHFGPPTPGEHGSYIRLAFSGIDVGEIREGLQRFKAWIERGVRAATP
jgi:aspartate/methionine/tyrosine aminotransferase